MNEKDIKNIEINNKPKEIPDTAPNFWQRLRNRLLSRYGVAAIGGTVAVTGAAIGINYAIDSHQSIDNPDLTYNFDNNVEKNIIDVGKNTKLVPADQLSSLLEDNVGPVVKGQRPDLTIVSPIDFSDNQKIEMEAMHIPQNLVSEQTKNLIIGERFTIPNKGTPIKLTLENAEILRRNFQRQEGDRIYFQSALIRFKGPDGATYILEITSENDFRQLIPLDTIKDAPLIGGEGGKSFTLDQLCKTEGLTTLPLGENILETNVNNAQVIMRILTPAQQYNDKATHDALSQCGFKLETTQDEKGTMVVGIAPKQAKP